MNSRTTERHTVATEMHIWARPWPSYEENPTGQPWKFVLLPWGKDIHTHNDDVYVGKTDVAFTVPGGIDLLGNAVSALEDQKAQLRAQTYKKCAEIDDQIRRLQAIEHKPEVANVE